ncbi:hypothetical protein N8I77_000096 [Diaporthe amygdali]|uniref:VOC domain-containing protein n=1 Tax=Phomopsis amygdali TaxID=1214568 RepID=A0AAD9SNW2_PHOAM|nr:hypothetical protein N8I77_000096 [Diaporthe amygdali]
MQPSHIDSGRSWPEPVPGVFHVGGHYDDPPLRSTDPSIGINLNHIMIRIRDPERSLHFYRDLMGMRTVWTMNTGPFTIYYLGYPSTDAERADLDTWAERTSDIRTLTRYKGLLELKHIHGSEKPVEEGGVEISNGNTPPNMGFGHLGFTVPDVRRTVDRLRAAGVRVLKEMDFNGRASIPLTEWERQRGVGVEDMVETYKNTIKQVAMVADPVSSSMYIVNKIGLTTCGKDGYFVELVPQIMH